VKLAQNQVWKRGDEYLRIVHLERLEVHYKAISDLLSGRGTHHHVSKKEFSRLIKGATLLTEAEVREVWLSGGKTSPGETPLG
jgi:pyridoxal biosynthesis lyase PdxS